MDRKEFVKNALNDSKSLPEFVKMFENDVQRLNNSLMRDYVTTPPTSMACGYVLVEKETVESLVSILSGLLLAASEFNREIKEFVNSEQKINV